jgi:prepilin-type N-terminal cleavage/methylation domain-containing protein
MKKMRTIKGFTLVEMLAVCMIIGLAVVFIYYLFIINWRSFELGVDRADLQFQARRALETMTRDVHFSRGFSIGAGGRQLTITWPPAPGTPNERTVVYLLAGGAGPGAARLTRSVEGANPEFICDRVTLGGSQFTQAGDSVEIQLTLTANTLFVRPRNSTDVVVQTRVTRRNR